MSALRRLFDARMASLAVVALAVVAAIVLVVEALVWYSGERSALAEQEFRTAQLEARATSLSARQEKAEEQTVGATGQILVQGDTPGLVMAELQRIVAYNAEMAGAVVRSVDTPSGGLLASQDAAVDGLERVRLTAEIEVTEQLLPDFLYALETDRTVLIVDGFSLRGRRSIESAGSEAFAAAGRDLTLRLDLSSFRLEETP